MRARVRWPQANLFAVLVFSGLRFGDFALAQPVAFAVHLEDMDVVGKRPVVTLPGCNSTASARLAC